MFTTFVLLMVFNLSGLRLNILGRGHKAWLRKLNASIIQILENDYKAKLYVDQP